MRTINWVVENGLVGCRQTGTIEVEDDASDEEINEMVREEVFNVIEWSWSDAG